MSRRGLAAMKYELHPNQSQLSKALYVIRLRHGPFRSAGRWIRRTVAQRRASNERDWASRMKPNPWRPKPWQPDSGRESPREEWMSWRRSMLHYAYPGWMRFHQRNRDHLAATPWWHIAPHIERAQALSQWRCQAPPPLPLAPLPERPGNG
jgi:hypothetical protein